MALTYVKVDVPGIGQVELAVEDAGTGRPFLLLHGGAGPASVIGFAALLVERHPARAIAPVHPGFARTPPADGLDDIAGLARLYAAFLDQLAIPDVMVIGNSIGGWVAAELALLRSPWVGGVILVDAVGIDVPGHPVTEVSGLTVPQIMARSYHDPRPFLVDPQSLPQEQRDIMAANRAALEVYAPRMTDPSLADRLSALDLPVLVLWGESDGIVDVEYGRAYADAIPGAAFEVLPGTGHVPQVETPELLLEAVWTYGDGDVTGQAFQLR